MAHERESQVKLEGIADVLYHHNIGRHKPYRNLERPSYMETNLLCGKIGVLLQIFAEFLEWYFIFSVFFVADFTVMLYICGYKMQVICWNGYLN